MITQTAQHKGMITKIHVAKSKLAMEENSYRAMLMRVTGKTSSKLMSIRELESVVAEMSRLGFTSHKSRIGKRKQADGAQVSKIRALWLDLYNLGQINDPSEEALTAYVRRMSKISAMEWLTPLKADAVIKGLRGWLNRIGFVFPTALEAREIARQRIQAHVDTPDDGFDYNALSVKIFMVRFQQIVLGADPQLADAKAVFVKEEFLDRVIEAQGIEIRSAKA